MGDRTESWFGPGQRRSPSCTVFGVFGPKRAIDIMILRPRPAIVDFDPPRLVSITFYDMVDEDQVMEAFDRVESLVGRLPFYLLELHTKEIAGATPLGRRMAAERMRALPERAMTVVGGDFAQRTLANLLVKAAQVLERERNNDYKICKTTEESRAWLEERAAARSPAKGR